MPRATCTLLIPESLSLSTKALDVTLVPEVARATEHVMAVSH